MKKKFKASVCVKAGCILNIIVLLFGVIGLLLMLIVKTTLWNITWITMFGQFMSSKNMDFINHFIGGFSTGFIVCFAFIFFIYFSVKIMRGTASSRTKIVVGILSLFFMGLLSGILILVGEYKKIKSNKWKNQDDDDDDYED